MAQSDLGTAAAPRSRAWFVALGALVLVVVIGILALGGASSDSSSPSALVLAPVALLAGVFSFLSPCTLPILPAYFAYTFQAQRERVVLMSVAFFCGLATTVVLFGATATALSQLLFGVKEYITLIGGVLIIIFGVMSLLGRGFSGVQMIQRPTATLLGSYIYGATFAVGWTACIGPIYGSLLMMLASQGIAVLQGAILAFVYALGLGLPLIIMASFFARLGTGSRFWRFIKGRGISLNLGFTTLELHSTSVLSGLLLILVGALLMTGQIEALGQWAQGTRMGQWALDIEFALDRLFLGR